MTLDSQSFDIRTLDEPITVCAHDYRWSSWYETEVASLHVPLKELHADYAHVGSSAVPGLKAKPIIDILIGVERLMLSREAEAGLISLGYEYFGQIHMDQERLFARKRGERSFNLQIVPKGSREWNEKLAFRDYLRAHWQEVRLYSDIKDEALNAGKKQLLEYHRYKDQVVSGILGRALVWDAAGRPSALGEEK